MMKGKMDTKRGRGGRAPSPNLTTGAALESSAVHALRP